MERAEIERFIVREVAAQLKPIVAELHENTEATKNIAKWKLALWSNGSGGPPGYLEISRAQDTQRYEELKKAHEDLGEKIDELKTAQTFNDGSAQGVEKRNKALNSNWTMFIALIGVLIAFVMMVIGVAAFIGSKVKSGEVVIPLHIKTMDANPPKVYAKEEVPQDAKGW